MGKTNGKFIKMKSELLENNGETIIKPTTTGTMQHLYSESLMLFDFAKYNGKNYRLFYGIGVVRRVVHGDKQDLIYLNFGFFRTHYTRLVVAFENHARRQTLTLKRGQICQVYGLCRNYTYEYEKNGEKLKGVRLGLYARAINGWYVPTMLDIKKMPVNEDLVAPSEKEQELQETFEQVLNEFMNGGEEENE